MIRDPSDGSVREPNRCEKPIFDEKPVLGTGASGLPPTTTNATQLARLERDREWLKNYLHRKVEVDGGSS
jgi:hypothetical protein